MANERDPGAGSSSGNGDLSVTDETLLGFKKRLDEVLSHLSNSPASTTKMQNQTITRDAYGGTAFPAADDLSKQYDRVHARLETLSRIFGEQIEALGIAVQISQKGYAGVEADQLARMRAIQSSAAQHYEAPAAPSNGGDGQRTGTSDEIIY
jgi:hypothetical protein